MNDTKEIEVKKEKIPGTKIPRPRDRKPGETEDEYVNGYLIGEYYSNFFPKSVEDFQKHSNEYMDDIETEEIKKDSTIQYIIEPPHGKEKQKKEKENNVEVEEGSKIGKCSYADRTLLYKLRVPIMRKKISLAYAEILVKILSPEQNKELDTSYNESSSFRH